MNIEKNINDIEELLKYINNIKININDHLINNINNENNINKSLCYLYMIAKKKFK
jgi:hypothetical protein